MIIDSMGIARGKGGIFIHHNIGYCYGVFDTYGNGKGCGSGSGTGCGNSFGNGYGIVYDNRGGDGLGSGDISGVVDTRL